MVAASKIAGMAVSGLLSFGVPVLLLILWRKRTGAKWTAALCGAIIFIVFALVLEGFCHRLFIFGDSSVSKFINDNIWAYALYGCLAAGVFEETGRFVAFKWILRKQNGKETSVMYGIGHGGIEAMLLAGVAAISNLAFALSLNMVGLDALVASAGAGAESVRMIAEQIMNTGAGLFFVSGIERLIAITLHIALSVLVFFAAKRENKFYLYPVAILLHALVDAFAVLYQRGVIGSIAVVELCVGAVTALIAVYAWRLYRADSAPAEPLPDITEASGGDADLPDEA